MILLFVLALVTGVPGGIQAADSTRARQAGPRERTGKPWIDMDYGPSLSLTLEASPGNFAYKGLAIRLDEGPGGISQGSEFAVFDTDTLRYSAAWSGPGFIDWQCIHFDGQHAVHPRPVGPILFENPPGPGWARPATESFADERLLGRDGRRYGPLDRQWGHWKGHYHHGDQVILSYRVGHADILEMPESAGDGETRGFARTLHIGPRGQALVMQVAHHASAQVSQHAGGGERSSGRYVMLAADESSISEPEVGGILCIGLVGGPVGCEWITTKDGHVRLRIPAGSDTERLKIIYMRFRSADDLPHFESLLANSTPPRELEPLTHGAPRRWTAEISTKPELVGSTDGPYVAESITLPHENPYRSWMRLGGFDFFEDGHRAAVCTWQGDVWIVDGIGSELDRKGAINAWRRIASGMFQPLGLKIVDGDIYVTCRDQITVLRDLNGDEEIDFYENFNNDHQVTEHFHEFAVGLQTDAEGNFYYAKCARHALDALVPHHGTLLKVSKDGSTTEIVASGYRAPNGVCVNKDGTFFLSDQEGHWTPKNRINWVRPGRFYGNMMAYHEGRDANDFEPPVCWIHNNYDRSPSEQLWVTSDRWGPVANSLLTLSYGTGEIHLVLHEMAGGVMQGGVVRLPIVNLPTGIVRGRFHPRDGQLYCCGLFGWSSNQTSPGGFYRIRYTGAPLHVPIRMLAVSDGLKIAFTEPLDETSASNVRNWTASRWQYRRTRNYGSDDYRVDTPDRQGRERMQVEAVEVAEDRRSVHLKLRDMRPAMQMGVQYSLTAADGTKLSQVIHHTVHTIETPDQSVPVEEGKHHLQPGLIAEFSQAIGGPRQDARDVRLPALFVPAGEPPTPFLPSRPFKTVFRGFVAPELRGNYTFHVAGQGRVVLRINGFEVLRGEGELAHAAPGTVHLDRDYTPFELEYTSLDDGRAVLRLDWQRRAEHFSDDRAFEVEPMPPSVFWHDPHDRPLLRPLQLRRGRELFVNLNCVRCHSLSDLATDARQQIPHLSRQNPSLAMAGNRLRRDWLTQWIVDPAALRDDVTMPQLFGATLDEAEREEVADLIAYLESLVDSESFDSTPPETEDDELVRAGELLYEDLGCIACHRFTSPADEDAYDRTSLYAAGGKFRPGALAAFLEAPHAAFPQSRMPDFKLTREEATALAAFIRSRSPWRASEDADLPEGEAAKGRVVYQKRGCVACHDVPGAEVHSVPPAQVPLAGSESLHRGCLAGPGKERGAAPVYPLTEDELGDLRMFLSSGELAVEALKAHVPVEAAESLVAQLRCTACHQRDDQFSVLSEVLLEEGVQGLPPGGIPALTWTGEKLQRDWMRTLLAGELDYRARPWLKARMPAFPAYAEPLAHGLPRQHGFGGEPRPEPELDPQLASVGETLSQQFGGFYCTECHSAGGRPPTSAFDHRGIDFPFVTERLQYDYYHRWMRDPQRIDPSTKMPQFAKEPRPDVLEGDAHRQFDALWHYLQSLER